MICNTLRGQIKGILGCTYLILYLVFRYNKKYPVVRALFLLCPENLLKL